MIASTSARHRRLALPSHTAATGKSCRLKSTVNAAIAKNKVSGAVRLHYVSVPISCPTDGLNWIKRAFIFPIYKSLTLARIS